MEHMEIYLEAVSVVYAILEMYGTGYEGQIHVCRKSVGNAETRTKMIIW